MTAQTSYRLGSSEAGNDCDIGRAGRKRLRYAGADETRQNDGRCLRAMRFHPDGQLFSSWR